MRRDARTWVGVVGLVLAAAGCGGEDAATLQRPPVSATASPSLAEAPRRAGEVLLRADASPRTHGPVRLDGRYTVRFQQYAPEDPRADFAGQTAFVVELRRAASAPPLRLFRAARATGRRIVTLHGRYLVDVSFGDFPYI